MKRNNIDLVRVHYTAQGECVYQSFLSEKDAQIFIQKNAFDDNEYTIFHCNEPTLSEFENDRYLE